MQNIDSLPTTAPLRFRLPEDITSIITQDIPAGIPFTIPYATSLFTKWETGSYIEQGVFQKGFGFCMLNFSIEKSIELTVEATQPFSTIQYTLKGETTAKLSGHGFMILSEGTYTSMYIPEGVHQVWFKPGNYTFFYLLLSDDHLQFLQEDHPHLQALVTNIIVASKDGLVLERMNINPATRRLIDHLLELKSTGTLLKFELEQIVIKLLLIYSDHILQRKDTIDQLSFGHFTDFITVYVLDNLTRPEDMNMEKLQTMFNNSERTLERHFKKRHGETLRSYLQRLRMDRALFMLLADQTSISHVAFLLGYKDAYTFSRQFTKHYGYPPKNAKELFYSL
jgi:AraC-like DNA-binding protein